jgi:hypothetical protein
MPTEVMEKRREAGTHKEGTLGAGQILGSTVRLE